VQHYPLKQISQSNLDRLAASVLESYSYQDLYQFSYQKALKNEAGIQTNNVRIYSGEAVQVIPAR